MGECTYNLLSKIGKNPINIRYLRFSVTKHCIGRLSLKIKMYVHFSVLMFWEWPLSNSVQINCQLIQITLYFISAEDHKCHYKSFYANSKEKVGFFLWCPLIIVMYLVFYACVLWVTNLIAATYAARFLTEFRYSKPPSHPHLIVMKTPLK